jgi:hypothetical protein
MKSTRYLPNVSPIDNTGPAFGENTASNNGNTAVAPSIRIHRIFHRSPVSSVLKIIVTKGK